LPLRDYGGKTPPELAERPDVVVVVFSLPARLPTYLPTYFLPACLRAVYACAFVFLPTWRDRSGFSSLAFSLVYVLLRLLLLLFLVLRTRAFSPSLRWIFFPLLLLLLLPSMAGLCSLGALIARIFKESFVVTFVLAL
jgi:hypothetical protein